MIKNAITQAFGRLAPTVRLGWRDEENIIVAIPDRAQRFSGPSTGLEVIVPGHQSIRA
jgi:hypothetical protein